MKWLPNLMGILRILGTLCLFFIQVLSPLWIAVYAACGITDVLDGWIARTFNATSDAGAVLDSTADFLFILIILFQLLNNYSIPFEVILTIAIISAVKGLSLIVGFLKFKTLAWLHSYSNKISGIFIFVLVPSYFLFPESQGPILLFLGIAAGYSAAEELIVIIISKQLNLNTKSIFSVIGEHQKNTDSQ